MKIIQIIPLSNWFAVYNVDDGNGPIAKELAFVALVEHEGIQKVVGYDGGEKFTSVENNPEFLGYCHQREVESMLVEEIDEQE